jgi:hypothetical protein
VGPLPKRHINEMNFGFGRLRPAAGEGSRGDPCRESHGAAPSQGPGCQDRQSSSSGLAQGHSTALPEPPAARWRRLWIIWLEAALNPHRVALAVRGFVQQSFCNAAG